MFGLTEARIRRYSRQIILPHAGGKGQRRLLSSKVLVVGVGGLGMLCNVMGTTLAATGLFSGASR